MKKHNNIKKSSKQLLARIEKKFEIPDFYITRQDLETMGYDTANVDDTTMERLADFISKTTDWTNGTVREFARAFSIPKHQAKPTK